LIGITDWINGGLVVQKVEKQRYHELLSASLWPLWAILLLIVLFRSSLFESLWLDETLSYFVINADWHSVATRATAYQGQSPLYFYLLKSWVSVFGSTEFAMRALSVAFALLALPPIWLLGRALINVNFAHATLLLLIANEGWQRTFSARPYALAFAFALWAVWFFYLWCGSGRKRLAFLALVCLLVATYAHYLFAATLGVLFLINQLYCPDSKRQRSFLWLAAVFLILLIPAALQLKMLFSRSAVLTIAEPSFVEWLRIVFPPMELAAICCAVASGLILWPSSRILPHRGSIWLLWIGWGIIGPFIFLIVSLLLSIGLVGERYLLWALPGSLFLFAQILSAVEPISARKRAIVVLAILLIFGQSVRTLHPEPWRDVAAQLTADQSKNGEIYLYSGLIELNDPQSFSSDAAKYLIAPLAYYSPSSLVHPVPPHLEGKVWEEIRRQLGEQLGKNTQAIFVLKNDRIGATSRTTAKYYEELLLSLGYKISKRESFGISRSEIVVIWATNSKPA
jgi:hypothetical protein